jgi:hypothetical protein
LLSCLLCVVLPAFHKSPGLHAQQQTGRGCDLLLLLMACMACLLLRLLD